MKKVCLIFSHFVAWACFALILSGKASAQCSITAPADGCEGVPVSFEATGPSTSGADSIVWTFATGKSKGPKITNLWNTQTGGPTPVTMKVYKGGVETCSANSTITIHANPVADFILSSKNPQCFKGNCYRFTDISTKPGNNPIIWREFLFGDGGKQVDSVPNPIPAIIGGSGTSCYTYKPANPAGGDFDPILRIRDSKGCVGFVQKTALITIKRDLGAKFSTPNPKNCKVTPTPFTNSTAVPKTDIKNFVWDFGDGTWDSTNLNWTGFTHTYIADGCFAARLYIESNDGCLDTFKTQAACNVNVKLKVSVDNGDVQCASNQNFVFNHPQIPGATLKWEFDDPPSGARNEDRIRWRVQHDFTGAGPYDVKFSLKTQGCDFDTVYRVHVKGPLATIENKPAPIIPPSQRYQCKIRDTVYFPNLSTYYFNDDSAFNDFYYSVSGAVFQLIDKTTAHVDFDTINLAKGVSQSFTTRTGRKVYISKAGDSVAINKDTLILNGTYLVKGTNESNIDQFNTKGKHVDRVWNFADNVAPQCTTDSRAIYPKAAKYGNLHWPTTPAPAWTYDKDGHWYNCNFNRDSLPKHWYTPGNEQCYTVRLILQDTSAKDPNIQSLTASHNDPSRPDSACQSVATVNLALTAPDASGLRWEGVPCYGPTNVYGFDFDFSRTGPGCDRQFFWIHLDSLADRIDNTPKTFDKWIPQNNTVVNRAGTPWIIATLNLPPNVGGIYWQYQPNGAYPSKIADKAGWVTIGYRVQNGVDPVTGQPCVDERWYHNAYRYLQSNATFTFHKVDKPDSAYTLEHVCPNNDVYVKRDSTVLSAGNTYTYASDSIGVEIWSWGDGVVEIDTFVRYNCIGTKCYSYRMRYKIEGLAAPVLIDSVITRVYDATTGKTVFLDARDSVPDIVRGHRYTNAARQIVFHTIIPCQRLPVDSSGFTIYRKTCCDAPPFSNARIAITGFYSDLNVSDSIVCRNTPIQFFDSARYNTEGGLPDTYDYWKTPTLYSDGSSRTRPRPFPADYEKLRWDFGDGRGWNASVPDNPTRSYPDPGTYTVKLEYTDSLGCKQIEEKKISVIGLSANFTFNRNLVNCRPTVDFTDTTLMLDPCRLVKNSKCDDIKSWYWDFGDHKPNNQSQSILQNPSKVYTSFGDFEVLLIVETRLGCKDSIKRTISLEGPRPRFEFAADSIGCVPFTVELRNISINPTANAEWTWFFGDGDFATTAKDTNMTHTYDSAGTFEIFLLQKDATPLGTGRCDALYPDTGQTFGQYRKFIVRVLPSRKTSFTISDSVICVGDSVTFISKSDSIYSTYKWITGAGDTIVKAKTAGGDTAGKKYKAPGVYYVQLRPTYTPPPGEPTCPTSAVHPVFVRDVKATIVCDTSQKPNMAFANKSKNAQKWWWDFGAGQGFEDGLAMATNPNARHNYGENKGFYTVLLAVESPEGCKDTDFCQFIYDYQVKFNPPNVFTPGDGNTLNDFFDVDVQNEEEYKLNIYNRWGESVYESEDKNAKWNGNHKGDGSPCPAGAYFVVIKYRLRGDKDKIYHGTLSLIR